MKKKKKPQILNWNQELGLKLKPLELKLEQVPLAGCESRTI